jgi:4-hydroxybenzoyl-CoA thioesterase
MSFVSKWEVRVTWGDCDPARIVFYPNYMVWFDHATHVLMERLDCAHKALIERYGIVGLPIADVSARFLRPSRWDDHVNIESRIESCAEKFFTVLHQGYCEGKLRVEGREVRFFARRHPEDPERLIADPIPAEIAELFKR